MMNERIKRYLNYAEGICCSIHLEVEQVSGEMSANCIETARTDLLEMIEELKALHRGLRDSVEKQKWCWNDERTFLLEEYAKLRNNEHVIK